MKELFAEFKKFISRGNVIELAVGLILATYFGAIVKSLVNDIIMPPIGFLIAETDFSDLSIIISEKVLDDGKVETVAINYGLFINTIITFLIVSIATFAMVKIYNRFLKKEETKPNPAPSKQEVLLAEIRDLLKEK